MKSGAALSGAAHVALIALAVMGLPWFSRSERPPVPVTEVSFVTEAEFDRAQAATQAPRVADAPAVKPVARPVAPETPPQDTPEAEAPPPAEPAPAPEQEVATLSPSFNPDMPLTVPSVQMTPPAPTPTPSKPVPLAAAAPPRARPSMPLAAAPIPAVEPRPVEAPKPEPEPTPEPPRAPTPPEPEAAPEAAPQTLALDSAAPPPPRPDTVPAPTATPQASAVLQALKEEVARQQRAKSATPATKPTVTAATRPTVTPATEPTPPSDGQAEETSLPSGPPITNAEKSGLRLAVQKCWNLPAGMRDASELKVTLAAELTPDGKVINGSIRLIDPSPAPDARFQAAYDAGRRALIRCSPYTDLPREKYAQWRNIEVVFNPEGMVSW